MKILIKIVQWVVFIVSSSMIAALMACEYYDLLIGLASAIFILIVIALVVFGEVTIKKSNKEETK